MKLHEIPLKFKNQNQNELKKKFFTVQIKNQKIIVRIKKIKPANTKYH